MIAEHDLAVLTRPLATDRYTLHVGDVGPVVHVHEAGAAYEVEFVTADGHAIDVVTLDAAAIRPAGPNEILSVRPVTG